MTRASSFRRHLARLPMTGHARLESVQFLDRADQGFGLIYWPYGNALRKTGSCPGPQPRSLDFEAGRLDDRPPFRDLGALQRVERLRRLQLAWQGFVSEVAEPS